MAIGNDVTIDSYVGHIWVAKTNGQIVREWMVKSSEDTTFVLKAEDLIQ